jgi:transcriptional regulator with XRE-family HTH domain
VQQLPTLGQVVAENLRRLREDAGFRQDDLARRSRLVGLDWTASTVAAVETNRRAVALDEAFLLTMVLECSFADLLDGDGAARLGSRAEVDLETLRQLATGEKGGEVTGFTTSERSRAAREAEHELRRLRPLWPKMTLNDLHRAEEAAEGEAERKAARRLGVDPVTISVIAHRVWGHSLTAERDEQAGPDAGAAARGHITRALLDFLEGYLGQRRKG